VGIESAQGLLRVPEEAAVMSIVMRHYCLLLAAKKTELRNF
jgi:hypothetical protein